MHPQYPWVQQDLLETKPYEPAKKGRLQQKLRRAPFPNARSVAFDVVREDPFDQSAHAPPRSAEFVDLANALMKAVPEFEPHTVHQVAELIQNWWLGSIEQGFRLRDDHSSLDMEAIDRECSTQELFEKLEAQSTLSLGPSIGTLEARLRQLFDKLEAQSTQFGFVEAKDLTEDIVGVVRAVVSSTITKCHGIPEIAAAVLSQESCQEVSEALKALFNGKGPASPRAYRIPSQPKHGKSVRSDFFPPAKHERSEVLTNLDDVLKSAFENLEDSTAIKISDIIAKYVDGESPGVYLAESCTELNPVFFQEWQSSVDLNRHTIGLASSIAKIIHAFKQTKELPLKELRFLPFSKGKLLEQALAKLKFSKHILSESIPKRQLEQHTIPTRRQEIINLDNTLLDLLKSDPPSREIVAQLSDLMKKHLCDHPGRQKTGIAFVAATRSHGREAPSFDLAGDMQALRTAKPWAATAALQAIKTVEQTFRILNFNNDFKFNGSRTIIFVS